MAPGAKARSANHSICISKGLKPPASTEPPNLTKIHEFLVLLEEVAILFESSKEASRIRSESNIQHADNCRSQASQTVVPQKLVGSLGLKGPSAQSSNNYNERSSWSASVLTHFVLNVHR